MMNELHYYAVTITPLHYKTHNGIKYKDYSHANQERVIITTMDLLKDFVKDYLITFETCPTSGIRHAHLCMLCAPTALYDIQKIVCTYLSYWNARTIIENTILMKLITTSIGYQIWQSYMYKELEHQYMFQAHVEALAVNCLQMPLAQKDT